MNLYQEIKEKIIADKQFKIVYYGPSTTSFEYIFPNWGEILKYVLKETFSEEVKDYKKAYWNIKTINNGLDGADSQELLKRLSINIENNTDLIILNIGKNDFYYQKNIEETKKNTEEIFNKILDKKIKIIFTSMFPSLRKDLNKKLSKHIDLERVIAKKFISDNFMFIDLFSLVNYEKIKKSFSLISSGDNIDVGFKKGDIDPIHYNKYGNALVAKIILKQAFNIEFNTNKFLKDCDNKSIKYPRF